MEDYLLILKPCQSGKTFSMIQQISKMCTDDDTISFILCDNSILQTIQTNDRLNNDQSLESFKDEDGDFSLICSSKSEYKDDTVFSQLVTNKIKSVVFCTNAKQLKTITNLIKNINRVNYKNTPKIRIFLDEADKFIKNYKNVIEEWVNLIESANYPKITFMTATPAPILEVFNEIPILQFEETVDKTVYHRFSESIFGYNNFDPKAKSAEYARHILTKNVECLKKGSVWFAPAEVKKVSHDEMTNLLFEFGFDIVIKINGYEKKIYEHGKEVTDIKEMKSSNGKKVINEKMMSDWIAECYNEHDMKNKLVAFTGNLCINRGITIQSNKLLITHAILPEQRNKENAYQIAGRLCGNIKQCENYNPPVVFCSKKTKDLICSMEEKAVRLPEIANILTSNEYKSHGEIGQDWPAGWKTFTSYDDALEYYNNPQGDKTTKIQKRTVLPKMKDEENGFIRSSLTKDKEIVSFDNLEQAMQSWKKSSLLDIGKIKESHYGRRLIVSYQDMNDNTSIRYTIKWIRKP